MSPTEDDKVREAVRAILEDTLSLAQLIDMPRVAMRVQQALAKLTTHEEPAVNAEGRPATRGH